MGASSAHACVVFVLAFSASCGGSGGAPLGLMVGAPTMATQWRDVTAGFAAHDDFPLGRDSAAADIDGDGDEDVCSAGHLYRNLGGGFFARVTTPLPTWGAAAFGDVDLDGDLDMMVKDEGLHLWINDGTGAFADVSATRLPPGPEIVSDIALTDLDGDGDLDAFLGRSGWFDVVYLNSGGSFHDATATWLPGEGASVYEVLAADFDGDGDPDVIAGGGTRFLRNTGSALVVDSSVVLPSPGAPAVERVLRGGDVDGDGDLDVLMTAATSTSVSLLRNDGTGHFVGSLLPGPVISGLGVAGLALGDIDGDADLDALLPQTGNAWHNDGTGNFALAPTGSLPALGCQVLCCLFDADRDGDVDLVAASPWRQPACLLASDERLLINDGTGRFRLIAFANSPPPGLACDLDGDGDTDFAHDSAAWFGDGFGNFTSIPWSALCTPERPVWRLLAATDLDGDGDVDLVWNKTTIYRNDGSGHFTADPTPLLPSDVAAVLDSDGDSDLDVVYADQFDPRPLLLLRNDGTAGFVAVTTSHLPSNPMRVSDLAAGDVDGDGDPDLVVMLRDDLLVLTNVSGMFVARTVSPLPFDHYTVAKVTLVDLDGDGDLDLLANRSRTHCLFENVGKGEFVNASLRLNPPSPVLRFTAFDLDGDGDRDLATQDEAWLQVFLQDAPLRFRLDPGVRRPTHFGSSGVPLLRDLADIDDDGDVDVGALRNLTRHVHLAALPTVGRALPIEVNAQPTWLPRALLAQVFVGFAAALPAVQVPSFGFFRIGSAGLVDLSPVTIPSPVGVVTVTVDLPALPALVGLQIYAQALVTDPSTGQGRFTNAVRATIGN